MPLPPPPKMLKLSDVPAFIKAKTGETVTRQTVYNWRKFGKTGTKLQAQKTVKGFVTTEGWVLDFLANVSR